MLLSFISASANEWFYTENQLSEASMQFNEIFLDMPMPLSDFKQIYVHAMFGQCCYVIMWNLRHSDTLCLTQIVEVRQKSTLSCFSEVTCYKIHFLLIK